MIEGIIMLIFASNKLASFFFPYFFWPSNFDNNYSKMLCFTIWHLNLHNQPEEDCRTEQATTCAHCRNLVFTVCGLSPSPDCPQKTKQKRKNSISKKNPKHKEGFAISRVGGQMFIAKVCSSES